MPDDHKELKQRLRELSTKTNLMAYWDDFTQAADLIESLEREVEREKARFNRRDRYREEQKQKVLNAMEAAAEERDRNAAVLEALTSGGAIDEAIKEIDWLSRPHRDPWQARNEMIEAVQAALQHAQEQVDDPDA